jgi:hypothetical protein
LAAADGVIPGLGVEAADADVPTEADALGGVDVPGGVTGVVVDVGVVGVGEGPG